MQQTTKAHTALIALALTASAASAVAPSPAAAQAWIGAMAGQMAADSARQQEEIACRKGAQPSAKQVAKTQVKIDQLMDAYFQLTPQSDNKAVRKVFATDLDDGRWEDARGGAPAAPLPLTQVGPHLGGPAPQRTLINTVVAGDKLSARAIWSAPAAGGGQPVIYAVDFVDELGWRIRRMLITTQANAPEPPAGYCHYDPEQGF